MCVCVCVCVCECVCERVRTDECVFIDLSVTTCVYQLHLAVWAMPDCTMVCLPLGLLLLTWIVLPCSLQAGVFSASGFPVP